MKASLPTFLLCSLLSFSVIQLCGAVDTIALNESISDRETLVSSDQSFELGFFSPSASRPSYRYLGIWYKNFPQIVVWIANRETPVTDSNGSLAFSNDGNLVVLNGTKSIIWSSSSSKAANAQDSVAQLLDSGNLVITQGSYRWQSFDYPSDTLLPGMKLGLNLTSGFTWNLRSWKDESDPSLGDFTYEHHIVGLPQGLILKGKKKIFRSGMRFWRWNGIQFGGNAPFSSPLYKPIFVSNREELYYMFESTDRSVLIRMTLNQTGKYSRYVLPKGGSQWAAMYTSPSACEEYGNCGPNGICRIDRMPMCECVQGFVPRSQSQWDVLDWSSGCVRKVPLGCQKGEGFVTLGDLKLPDLVNFSLNKGMNLDQCREECLKNCSCTAFANSDFRTGGGGCLLWVGDLIDIREYSESSSNQDLYLRVPSSELGLKKKRRRLELIIVVISTVSGMIVFSFLIWGIVRRKKKRGTEEDIELPLFDLATLTIATRNFSRQNMIGEGGFGTVYKGILPVGQEIAVKRLSKGSKQGLEEFKNEIILFSKLQHRNLVRLLGCCLEGEERMLVYEYMPQKSLDCLIFDQSRRVLLLWQSRFEIAVGIAKGLLYLHQDSRLRIIHRDLKASNVLLDNELNPKISDFGIARIFGGDQIEGKTKRIIGTYGYMSPEYAIAGKFSVKSDVFSFGVLLIEIVSGKRNTRFDHPDHYHSLLGHAWLLWNERKAMELLDACLQDTCVESQVLRCIQVGLLCIQKLPKDRPTMSSIVFMLSNEGVTLPQPKQPGFFTERASIGTDMLAGQDLCLSENEATITVLEASDGVSHENTRMRTRSIRSNCKKHQEKELSKEIVPVN